MQYSTIIHQVGNNTGIPIPEEVLLALGGGLKPLVKVTVNGYSYRTAVGKMNGQYLIPFSAEHRKISGLKGNDAVEVELVLDTEPRVVDVPPELQAALDADPAVKAAFEKLAPSRKKAMALSVADAKSPETKARRVEKAITELAR